MSNGNSHFHLHCYWKCIVMGPAWKSYHCPRHLWSTSNGARLHCDTDCIQQHYINFYSINNSREWDHCVLFGDCVYSYHYRIFNNPFGWWGLVHCPLSVCVKNVYIDPPGPPSTIRHSISSSSANEVSVTIGWNPPTETGGRDDLNYTVTVASPAQLSATVLTSTSVTVTAQYNVDYTVSVVATNCAGNSTTADYNFRVGEYIYFLHTTAEYSYRFGEST